MRIKHRITSFLLVVSMVIASFSAFIVSASAATDTVSLPSESAPSNQENIIPAENTSLDIDENTENTYDIIGEDVTKRDQFSKHYLCSDGSYVAVVCAETIHYQTDDGSWEEVDNTLSLDSSSEYYKNDKSKSGFGVSFSKNPNKEDAVVLSDGETSISWYIEGLKSGNSVNNKVTPSNSSKVKINNNKSNANSRLNGKSGKENSAISYENIFGEDIGAVLKYSVSENRIEEDIIFERVPQISSYTMNIRAPGMEVSLNEDGSVDIVAKNGKVSYTIDAPIMYDAAGVYSANVAVSVERHGNIIKVTYTPDMSWLEAPERVYPVTLDPVVTTSQYTSNITDTHVIENISSNYSSSTHMYVGYLGSRGYSKAYIKFNNIPDLGSYCYLNSAEMIVYSTGSVMDTYDLSFNYVTGTWSTSTITYANQPTEYNICSGEYDITCTESDQEVYDPDEDLYIDTVKFSFNFTDDIAEFLDYNDDPERSYWDSFQGFSIEYLGTDDTTVSYYLMASETEDSAFHPALVMSYIVYEDDFIYANGIYSLYNVGISKYLRFNETEMDYSSTADYHSMFHIDRFGEAYRITSLHYEEYDDDFGIVLSSNGTSVGFGYSSTVNTSTQSWIIAPVSTANSNSKFVIALANNPTKVLTCISDGDGYTFGISDYNELSTQQWEIHSGGHEYYCGSVNIRDIADSGSSLLYIESQSAKYFFCPATSIDSYVEWRSSVPYVSPINSQSGIVSYMQAGTTNLIADIYTGDDGSGVSEQVSISLIVRKANGVYTINSIYNTNYYIELSGGNISEDTPYVQSATENNRSSKFKITHLADGKYSIRSMEKSDMGLYAVQTNSGYFLTSKSIGTDDNVSAISEAAQWRIQATGVGEYSLINVLYPTYYITAPGTAIDGDQIILTNSYQSSSRQEWALTQNYGILRGVDIRSNQYYVAFGESIDLYATLYSDSASDNSQEMTWSLTNSSANYASIANKGNGHATLTANNTACTISVSVQSKTYSASSYYRKTITIDIVPLSNGNYYIVRSSSLSHYMQPNDNGNTDIEQHSFNYENIQLWTFTYDGDYYYRIASLHYPTKYLTANEENSSNEKLTYEILPDNDDDLDRMLWRISVNANGDCIIQAKRWIDDGEDLKVAVTSALSGAKVKQVSNPEDDKSLWRITKIPPEFGDYNDLSINENLVYKIVPSITTEDGISVLCLVDESDQENEHLIYTSDAKEKKDMSHHMWRFVKVGNSYKIYSMNTCYPTGSTENLLIGISSDGQYLVRTMYDTNEVNPQHLWNIYANDNGKVVISSVLYPTKYLSLLDDTYTVVASQYSGLNSTFTIPEYVNESYWEDSLNTANYYNFTPSSANHIKILLDENWDEDLISIDMVQQAINAWNGISEHIVLELETNTNNVGFHFTLIQDWEFSDSSSYACIDPKNAQGVTINDQFATWHTVDIKLDIDRIKNFTDSNIVQIMTHEIGHALKLSHTGEYYEYDEDGNKKFFKHSYTDTFYSIMQPFYTHSNITLYVTNFDKSALINKWKYLDEIN